MSAGRPTLLTTRPRTLISLGSANGRLSRIFLRVRSAAAIEYISLRLNSANESFS